MSREESNYDDPLEEEPLEPDQPEETTPAEPKKPLAGSDRRAFLGGLALAALGGAAAAENSVKSRILAKIAGEVQADGGGGTDAYVKGGYSKGGQYSKAAQYTKNGVDHYSKGIPGRKHYSKAPGDATYTKLSYSKYSKTDPPEFLKSPAYLKDIT